MTPLILLAIGHRGVMNRQTYVARGIPDLLDLMPALFGFAPEESLVAVVTHDPGRRFGFRLRIDLPPLHQVGAAAFQVVGHLRRQDPDGVVLVALSDRPHLADALMSAVVAGLHGVPIHEAARTDGARYWSYGPEGPGQATPYVRRSSPVVVEAIVSGMPILPSREALVARFAPVAGERKSEMEEATARVFAESVHELSPGTSLGIPGMARLDPIIAGHAAGLPLDDEARATLAIWVSSIDVRDAVWSRLTRRNADTALSLWTDVAQSVVEPFEVPVLCLAAFAAWLSGDGAQALIAVERALDKESDYGMAQMILQMLEAGVSPDRWDGFDPEPPAMAA